MHEKENEKLNKNEIISVNKQIFIISIFVLFLISISSSNVFAQYSSYHESRTGEVACGGQYSSYHESRTGKVCAGGDYRGR